jgi:plasmid stabilization system protein ParE
VPRLVWSTFAEADLDLSVEYVAVHGPGAAAALGEANPPRVDGLRDFPDIGRPGRVAGTRELVIVRTPYVLVYENTGNLVQILRVLHGPQEWPPSE